MDEETVNSAISDDKYLEMVNQDIQEARTIGVTGVPFFVFDRKYAVSGTQPPQAFLQTLEKSSLFFLFQKQIPVNHAYKYNTTNEITNSCRYQIFK